MPFKTFVAGQTLPATEVNDYLMKQVTATVTSTTRPSSPVNGQWIYETDTGLHQVRQAGAWVPVNFGVWTPYTPELTGSSGGGTLGNASVYARYVVQGKTVSGNVELIVGSTSNLGTGALEVSLPLTARAVNPAHIGEGLVVDASTSARYGVTVEHSTTAKVNLLISADGRIVTGGPSPVPWVWAPGDSIRFSVHYELP